MNNIIINFKKFLKKNNRNRHHLCECIPNNVQQENKTRSLGNVFNCTITKSVAADKKTVSVNKDYDCDMDIFLKIIIITIFH